MARKKLFGNRRHTSCDVCEFGRLSADGETVLCSRKGVVPAYHHCRRFRYDPLKRIPTRSQPLGQFSPSDFSLEDFTLDEYIPHKDIPAAQFPDTQTADTKKEVFQVSMANDNAFENEHLQDETVLSSEMVNRLKMYLSNSAAPTVRDIMHLLNMNDDGEEKSILPFEEHDAIFDDLQNLSFENVCSSIRASLLNGDICLADDMSEEDLQSFSDETLHVSDLRAKEKRALHASLDDTDSLRLIGVASDNLESSSPELSADSLIFLSDDDLSEEPGKSFSENPALINVVDFPDEPEESPMITLDDLPQGPEENPQDKPK